VNRTVRLIGTVPTAPGDLVIWRGTAAGSYDKYVSIPVDTYRFRFYDTGACMNRREWERWAGSPAVPTANATTSSLKLDSGTIWPILAAVQASDLSKASDTVLADIPGLSVTVEPNATYLVEVILAYEGSTTGDARVRASMPSGATMKWGASALATNAGSNTGSTNGQQWDGTGTVGVGAAGAGVVLMARLYGVLVTSANGGTFKLQGGQNTSDPTPTIFHATGTLLSAQRRI
jgi:hypothetical protein